MQVLNSDSREFESVIVQLWGISTGSQAAIILLIAKLAEAEGV